MKKTTVLILGALAAGAGAQVVAPTYIYAPARSIKSQKITLQGWGSGTIAETDGIAYEGTSCIRVSTRNYFQGGILNLNQPVDLGKKYDDKANLLRVTFFLEDAGWVYGQMAKNEHSGTMGGGLVGRGGGANALSLGSKNNVAGVPSIPFKPKIKDVRLIISTTDGKKSEVYVPVGTSQSAANALGWRSFAIPLQSIRGLERTNKMVSGIAVSADTYATMYVGAIDIMNDLTPITGGVNADKLNLALGDQVKLTAWGDGGASVLQYQWDFDDRDGIQVDSEGQTVTRKFRKEGSFKVTLTISDLYGLKKPYVTTFPVKVNP